MNLRRLIGLAAMLALLESGAGSGFFADEAVKETESWAKIVSARAVLDKLMGVDATTMVPEDLAAARKRVTDQASQLDDMANDFLDVFPDSTNVLRAIAHGCYAVGVSGVLGNYKSWAPAIERLTGMDLKSELAKEYPALSSQTDALRDIGETNLVAGAIDALHFPTTNRAVFFTLIWLGEKARSEAGRSLLRHLLTNSLLPADMAGSATSILNRQFSIGQPVDLKFSAMDGRKVDLTGMRGKVVLVNFWATTCAPCMAQLPDLKLMYERYRERGFEIVGISLDDESRLVEKVIKEKEIPWPNKVEGVGWTNGLPGRCGVFAPPDAWLVDKKGILREVAVRERLGEKVEILLNESP